MHTLLPQLLSEAAARYGERPAIVMDDRSCTYTDLEATSNRFARTLVGAGVARGDRVALWLPKSIDAVAALYGIMKAGAAYVPVDPASPAARLAYIARDCEVAALVTTTDRAASAEAAFGGEVPMRAVVYTDEKCDVVPLAGLPAIFPAELESQSPEAFQNPADSDDLAYILYTSGSTGEPKGVMISHRGSLAFVEWAARKFEISHRDRLANHAPFHFDLSTFDLFAGAWAGATVYPVAQRIAAFPAAVARQWADERLTVWYATPSTLILMLTRGNLAAYDLSSLRLLLFAGEVFPVKYLRALMSLAPQARFAILYGPTETNVCTCYEVALVPDGDEPLSIGSACSGDKIHVLDEAGRGVEDGSVGELWVSGPTVMRGYWGRPERTAQSLRAIRVNGMRVVAYRTGDLVRRRADGNLDFLGRRDHQIKTRGYRVELGEIEFTLNRHPAVDEAVALAVPDEQVTNLLKAVAVLKPGARVDENDLKQHCAATLPRYMVPESIEFRSELPRTSSDKVDRRALLAEMETTLRESDRRIESHGS